MLKIFLTADMAVGMAPLAVKLAFQFQIWFIGGFTLERMIRTVSFGNWLTHIRVQYLVNVVKWLIRWTKGVKSEAVTVSQI